MQPNPQRNDVSSAPRDVIYLGDVRRKREVGRQAPDTHYLLALALAALLAWGTWLVVLFNLPPAKLLTYLAFFIPLGLGLAATAALAAYFVERRPGHFGDLLAACRHGTIFAGIVVSNLAIIAAHLWNPIVGIVTLVLAFLADFLLRPRG